MASTSTVTPPAAPATSQAPVDPNMFTSYPQGVPQGTTPASLYVGELGNLIQLFCKNVYSCRSFCN